MSQIEDMIELSSAFAGPGNDLRSKVEDTMHANPRSLSRPGVPWWAAACCLLGFGLLAQERLRAEPPAAPDAATASDEIIPPAKAKYKGREIAVTMHYLGAPWLIRESRQREEDCAMLLEALGVKPGQTVCDMGCGNGFYTLQLARLVGEQGSVLAVDIQSEMLHLLSERAKEANINNIQLIQGTAIDPKLPEGGVDLILLVDVYHEFSHPQQMLDAMRRALKPQGRIALVEFRLEDRDVPIKLLHKMSKQQILKEFPPNGYKLVEQFDKLPWQHLMFFGRAESP
jgi:ubiquinone/menaquinone biosynthesis C-methylase UbiE